MSFCHNDNDDDRYHDNDDDDDDDDQLVYCSVAEGGRVSSGALLKDPS